MSDKVFLDTNVLVYLFDRDTPAKQKKARAVLESEGGAGHIIISTQVLDANGMRRGSCRSSMFAWWRHSL